MSREPQRRRLTTDGARLAAILDLQRRIAEAGPDLLSVMRLVSARAMWLSRADGACIDQREGDELVFRAPCGMMDAFDGKRIRVDNSLSGLALTSGRLLYSPDTEADERVDRTATRATGTRSLVVVPLIVGESCVGVLKVLSPHIDGFTPADIETLEIMAGLMASAIRQAMDYQAQQRLLDELRATFELAPIGMAVEDADGRVVRVNPAFCRLVARSEPDILGLSLADFFDADAPAHAEHDGVDGERAAKRLTTKDGEVRYVQVSTAVLHDDAGQTRGALSQFEDVTERRRAAELLKRQAYVDPLTGVANRAALQAVLGAECAARQDVGILFLDLDGFKAVNDRYGHSAGDRVLRVVASRILEVVRPTDVVARMGGDEFVVLCRDIAAVDTLADLGERIAAAVKREIGIGQAAVRVGSSVGWALGEDCGWSFDELLNRADRMMYQAKADRRSSRIRGKAWPIN